MENEQKQNGMSEILLSEEIAQGIYSNFAIITHSSSEFIVDFARILPGIPQPTVKSRIVLTPEHAKRLLMAMQDNILRYESQYGNITVEDRNVVPTLPFSAGEA